MPIKNLTNEEHLKVVERLHSLVGPYDGVHFHSAGPEYTSLMVCFLMHNLSAASALIKLKDSPTSDWFPATVGYIIARSMFEIDVTAHYITLKPIERSRKYILFENVLNKQEMDVYAKHRNSKDSQCREYTNLVWNNLWANNEQAINHRFSKIRDYYTHKDKKDKKGKERLYHNWSGKSIKQMAIEVDHEEAYDIFYSELSSFTHADIKLANRFLRIERDGISWSQRANEFDVGNVFRHAATFLTCFLTLFSEQFAVWSKEDVQRCWDFGNGS